MLNLFKKLFGLKKLETKNIIFSSSYTDGRSRGSGGMNLYNDGTVENWSSKFSTNKETKKWDRKSENKQGKISRSILDQIIELINSSGIIEKECPRAQTYDVVRSYTVNSNGKSKHFGDPGGNCGEVLRKIESLIREDLKQK